MNYSRLVIVHDLYVESVPVPPDKTHTVLIVNPYAVLSGALPAQRLQSVAGRHF